jgi:hypothetical protein
MSVPLQINKEIKKERKKELLIASTIVNILNTNNITRNQGIM